MQLLGNSNNFEGFNWETIGENSVKEVLGKMVLERRKVVLPKKIKHEDIEQIKHTLLKMTGKKLPEESLLI